MRPSWTRPSRCSSNAASVAVRKLLDVVSCDCEEQEAIRPVLSSRLDRMLELLCGDRVSWPAGRCELGKLVACADSRYKSLSEGDCVAVDDAMDDDGDLLLLVAPSQKRWRQARAVLSGMPEDMPAEEQAKRMHLAVFSPKKDIDVLTTFNVHGGIGGGTIASMVSELADGIGAVALSDRLARAVRRAPRATAAPTAGSSGTSAPQPPQSGTDPAAAAFARMYAAPHTVSYPPRPKLVTAAQRADRVGF